MIDREHFQFLKVKYSHWSSWAIWSAAGETPKSNVGDLSVFEGDNFLQFLNPEIFLVGLNISRGDIKNPLANFHDARAEATDYKIRYALTDSALWGGYMTDIIKDRSGPANLNSTISGNSGYKAGSKAVWEQGVSNGEEEGIGTTHTPYP